jgi:hypothetical protein
MPRERFGQAFLARRRKGTEEFVGTKSGEWITFF